MEMLFHFFLGELRETEAGFLKRCGLKEPTSDVGSAVGKGGVYFLLV
jgi:hypothetical protein